MPQTKLAGRTSNMEGLPDYIRSLTHQQKRVGLPKCSRAGAGQRTAGVGSGPPTAKQHFGTFLIFLPFKHYSFSHGIDRTNVSPFCRLQTMLLAAISDPSSKYETYCGSRFVVVKKAALVLNCSTMRGTSKSAISSAQTKV